MITKATPQITHFVFFTPPNSILLLNIADGRHSSKNTTKQQRDQIYKSLLERSNHGKLGKYCTRLVATAYNVSIWTLQHIWDSHKKCKAAGIPVNIKSKKAVNCGRKKVTLDPELIASIPLNERSTIRGLAQKTGIKKKHNS